MMPKMSSCRTAEQELMPVMSLQEGAYYTGSPHPVVKASEAKQTLDTIAMLFSTISTEQKRLTNGTN
jgi:hypothetical protein